jgi:hypothetical protein
MSDNLSPRKASNRQHKTASAPAVEVNWKAGERTAAWDELWRRILQYALSNQQSPAPDPDEADF